MAVQDGDASLYSAANDEALNRQFESLDSVDVPTVDSQTGKKESVTDQCELLKSWRTRLHLIASGRLSAKYRSRFDTSDVTQDALIQLWQNDHTKNGTDAQENSLFTKVTIGHVGKNVRHHSALKRDVERSETSYENEVSEGPSRSDAEQNEIIQQMAVAQETLHSDSQLVISCKFFEDMSFGEIAKVLQKSVRVVRTIYSKAIVELEKRLGEK